MDTCKKDWVSFLLEKFKGNSDALSEIEFVLQLMIEFARAAFNDATVSTEIDPRLSLKLVLNRNRAFSQTFGISIIPENHLIDDKEAERCIIEMIDDYLRKRSR